MNRRVLICGPRDWNLGWWPIDTFIYGLSPSDIVIEGEAPGVDSIARDVCKSLGHIEGEGYLSFPADWEGHGKSAGPIRNAHMLSQGKPTEVVAFIHKPLQHCRGTSNMLAQARDSGVPTLVVCAYDVCETK